TLIYSLCLHDALPISEFECQGLELDWTCVCWGNDFVFDPSLSTWAYWKLWGTSLRAVAEQDEQELARNVYRVLLTRAREGMVLRSEEHTSELQSRVDL